MIGYSQMVYIPITTEHCVIGSDAYGDGFIAMFAHQVLIYILKVSELVYIVIAFHKHF